MTDSGSLTGREDVENRDWWREQALRLEAELDEFYEQREALKERVRRAVDKALDAPPEEAGQT